MVEWEQKEHIANLKVLQFKNIGTKIVNKKSLENSGPLIKVCKKNKKNMHKLWGVPLRHNTLEETVQFYHVDNPNNQRTTLLSIYLWLNVQYSI